MVVSIAITQILVSKYSIIAHKKELGLRELADSRPETGKHTVCLRQLVPERAQT